MNINRDNYEEYFLLYADDELTDSEKVAVILFLKDNKDLEDEFRMIHHTISKPDAEVQLIDKSFLFKKDIAVFINEKNYEEFFVLYHDNELSEKEKMETEEFLSLHKKLKNEFDLIGLARLTPESSIVFPDKKILYKKEKKGKVVPIIFLRMFAAAVFVGFGLWITNLYFQKPVQLSNTIVKSIPLKNSLLEIKKDSIDQQKEAETAITLIEETFKKNEKDINNEKEQKQKKLDQKNNENLAVKTIAKKPATTKEDIINQLPDNANNETTVSTQDIKQIATGDISSTQKIDPSKDLVQVIDEKPQSENYAKTASYVAEVDNANENYVFYDITTTKFKKTKVSGFLKKVKRVIERTNPIGRLISGDDRQVVVK